MYARGMAHASQVWYSAAWSRSALETFRSALMTVLETAATATEPAQSVAPTVCAFLWHWLQLGDVSLEQVCPLGRAVYSLRKTNNYL